MERVVEVGWEEKKVFCFLFFSLRSKEFKRCPSLSVLLEGEGEEEEGEEFGTGTRATPPPSGQASPLGTSVGALLEVIFDLPSFPSQQFSFRFKIKESEKASD